jgi:hypothetical protein
MSFRVFVYYCALSGGAGALLGWVFGRVLGGGQGLVAQGLKGFYLGIALALALSLVDGLWNFSVRQTFSILVRVVTALFVGGMAGLLGGLAGEVLYGWRQWGVFLVLGYTLVGMLIGLSVGVFDLLASLAANRNSRGALRKVVNGLVGGAVGGILGGIVSLVVRGVWARLFHDKPSDLLWSPSAGGFFALGACIGLMIGLAQVILKEAWIKVEAGFRAGRELILARPEITIGRAENCDVGLFGDPSVERLHATISRQGNRYVVQDAGSAAGTLVNDEAISSARILRSGDVIRIGRAVLRFGERTREGRP